jgi:hypothetical protein
LEGVQSGEFKTGAGATFNHCVACLSDNDGINSDGTVVRGNFARANTGSIYSFAGGSSATLGPIPPVATATSPTANFQ